MPLWPCDPALLRGTFRREQDRHGDTLDLAAIRPPVRRRELNGDVAGCEDDLASL
jgi:hypothetical protein